MTRMEKHENRNRKKKADSKQDIVFRNFQNKLKKDKDTEWQPMNAEYLVDTLINALFKLSRDEFFDDRDLPPGFHVI